MGTVLQSKLEGQDKKEQQRDDIDILEGLHNPCGTPGTPLCQNPPLQQDVCYLDSRIALLIQNRMALEEVGNSASTSRYGLTG